MRRRLLEEMVARGLAPDAESASAAIERGDVTVGGAPASNPSRLVGADEPILVVGSARFVSRGGEKLDAALDELGVDVAGRRVLDLGSSTGGFTDCLLQRGAATVVAVDVGRSLLHERLRDDPRVSVHDGLHVRDVGSVVDLGSLDLVVADLSFISACAAIDATGRLVRSGCDLVVLVKPQFEAPREAADRGSGVVTDPSVVGEALSRVRACGVRAGLDVVGEVPSRTPGRRGNVEYFLHLRRPARF
ncbi:MAG: TlyA family RNA methyltransferase [Actinobacteria bacterium]|nr:TlyA family RNA methyltransferase [Actinomycetota bacterium]